MQKPKKKIFIYLTLLFVIILVLFPSLVYRILPAKQVTLETEFTIHKGQTVKFGQGKYLTVCGFRNIELTRAGSIISWKINGQRSPCEWTTYQFFDPQYSGPHNPYSLEEISGHSSGPLIVKIHESNDYYDKWSLDNLESNCNTIYNKTSSEDKDSKITCYKENPSHVGNSRVCKMQNFISEKDCLDGFIENFTKQCTPRKEKHNVEAGTWTSGVDNQDDCLKEQVLYRHLPSENCLLLIEDKMKSQSCFEERKKEEERFDLMQIN